MKADLRNILSFAEQLSVSIQLAVKKPSRCPQVAFNAVSSAGWFDFVPGVYQLTGSVPAPFVTAPVFAKVGSSNLPERIAL